MQNFAEAPAVSNEETSPQSLTPYTQSSMSLPSPSNRTNQQAPDFQNLVRYPEYESVIDPGISESIANHSPVTSQTLLRQCHPADAAPQDCNEVSFMGLRSDEASCSSISSESAGSDTTDRHRDLAFT
jgi:hypothetical protein